MIVDDSVEELEALVESRGSVINEALGRVMLIKSQMAPSTPIGILVEELFNLLMEAD